jgi:hypothetical protein
VATASPVTFATPAIVLAKPQLSPKPSRDMTKAQGGTRLWCPTCKMDTICAAIPIDPGARSQRIQRKATLAGDGEIHHFDRVRKCTICGEEFETIEIEIGFLYELAKLRDAMKVIRDKADALILWQK